MIFTTVEDEASRFGVRIDSVFTGLKNSFNNNLGGIQFSSTFSNALQNDISCLNAYAAAIQDPQTATNAFTTTMNGASAAAQQFAQSSNFSANAIGTFASQQKLLQVSLSAQDKSFGNISRIINTYNTGLSELGVNQEQYVSAVGESNSVLASYLSGLQSGEATMTGYIAKLVSAEAATIGLKIATMALNMAISAAVSMLISAALTALDNYIHRSERLIEASEEAAQAISDISSEYQKTADTVSDIGERFAELAQGVDQLTGANKSLTTSEHEEFLSLSNQLAETFPTLTRHYDENGNAIVGLTGNVDGIVESLQNLLDVERQLANQKIVDNLEDLYDGTREKSNQKNKEIEDLNNKYKEYSNAVDAVTNNDYYSDSFDRMIDSGIFHLESKGTDPATFKKISDAYERVFRDAGLEFFSENVLAGDETDFDFQNFLFSSSEAQIADARQKIEYGLQEIRTTFEKELGSITNRVSAKKEELNAIWNGMSEGLSTWLQTSDDYQIMNDIQKSAAKLMLSNIDYSSIDFSSIEDLQTYIQNNIVEKLNGLSDSDVFDLSKYMSLKPSDFDTIREYTEAEKELRKSLSDNSDFTEFELQSFSGIMDDIVDINDMISVIHNRLSDEPSALVDLSFDELKTAYDYLDSHPDATWSEIENINLLKDGLTSLAQSFSDVARAKAEYDAAIENGAKDDDYKAFADAYKKMQEEITAGRTNSAEYNAAAKMLLGEDMLDELRWDPEKINAQITQLSTAFGDAENSGYGLIQTLNQIAENGQILGDNGELLASISTNDDGTLALEVVAGKFDELAKKTGMSEEALKACYEALGNFGNLNLYDFDKISEALDPISSTSEEGTRYVGLEAYKQQLNDLGVEGREVYDIMRELEDREGIKFFDVNDDIETLKTNLQDLGALTIGEDGGIDINVDSLLETAGHLGLTADEAATLVDTLSLIDDVTFTDAEGNAIKLNDALQMIVDSADLIKPDALVALQEQADAAGQSLEEFAEDLFDLEEGSLHINVDDIEGATEKVTALEETIETLKNKRLELDNDENSEAEVAQIDALLQDCIKRKQMLSAPAIMSIDASAIGEVDVELGNAISKIQEFVSLSNQLEVEIATGVDTTDTQTKLAAVAGELAALPDETKTKLGLDKTAFDTAIADIAATEVDVKADVKISAESLAAVNTAISGIAPATIGASVNSAPVVTALGTVKTAVEAIPNEKNISVSAATSTAYSNLSSVATMLRNIQSKSVTVTVNRVVNTTEKGGGSAQGTAHAQGTAKKSGDWRVGRDTASLVGELGPELVVRDGKFFTVGDDSAEMVNLKKNDIVFNAEQTRQILLNGKITNGAKRGIAYAGGSVSGNAVYRLTIPNWASMPGAKVGYSSNRYTNDDDEPKEFDYIETALARIERAVDRVKDKADSASKSIDTRLKATGEEISAITAEIDMQSDAYDRYMREANAVGLSSSIAQKVRDGIIDITEYDDDTTKLINQYKDWYEKALDCADAIDELHESIADLYKDSFDNIQSYYKGFISQFEHMANTYNTKIDMFEATGYQVNESLYRELMATTQSSVYAMELELTDLKEAFATAMNSGEIEENSDAWFDMRQDIDDLAESIDKGYLDIVKFDKKIRELSWDNFDFILDRIEEINDESEFFIKMMEDNDLFDDDGVFTQYGTAVAGLHLEKYNVSMSQAKKYAEELLAINRKIAEDPYDRELLERREGLYQAQRKSIEAAKDEKDAIVDMVRDGIDVELDALDELISKYKDALDSSQDLYDYERKIEDETGEISKIQKQLLAYGGDNSEEAMAKRQKLNEDLKEAQKNLEETQYDKYIKDQKSMLDAFYTDYETAVNKRLDNVDALLSEVAGNINDAALDISDTIKKVAESFGYDLTSEMKSMWGSQPLSDQVSNVITSLESSLGIKSVEEKSGSDIANDKPENYKPPTSEKETKPNSETAPKTTTEDTAISVGGMINAGSASIFTSAYGGNALKQYFASDPIYTVLDEKNGFLLVRHHSLSKGSTGWFRKSDVKAYKNGGLVDYTGLAWVDGSKAKPEYILNSENTDSLLKMSSNARALSELPISSGGLPYSLGVGNVYSGVFNAAAETIASIVKTIGSGRDGFGDINVENEFNIPIDHVENYEDFVTKMQSDSKFNDMILAMTIDPLVGKSKFGKYKYKW